MSLTLATVEQILRADSRLKVIHDETYELAFESTSGRQIAVNRKASVRAIRVWVQNTFDPSRIGLSLDSQVIHYPPEKPRAHLSANRLTGPYGIRKGNDCWYIVITSEQDLRAILFASLQSL